VSRNLYILKSDGTPDAETATVQTVKSLWLRLRPTLFGEGITKHTIAGLEMRLKGLSEIKNDNSREKYLGKFKETEHDLAGLAPFLEGVALAVQDLREKDPYILSDVSMKKTEVPYFNKKEALYQEIPDVAQSNGNLESLVLDRREMYIADSIKREGKYDNLLYVSSDFSLDQVQDIGLNAYLLTIKGTEEGAEVCGSLPTAMKKILTADLKKAGFTYSEHGC
jgi:hypothetical protein